MTHTKLAVLAALALLPLVSSAQRTSPEVVGVLAVGDPPTGPQPELVDLTRSFRASVADKFQGVLPQEDLRLRMLGQTGASLTELDRAYSGAVAAFQAGDYEASARTLRAVVDDLERLPESEDGFRLWTRAMLRLARAEGSLGRKGESRDVLERLLKADPSAKADPELYPPSFVKQVEDVRAAQRALPRRKVVVTATGRNARVFVDGRDVGPAPVTLTLIPGRYRVSGMAGEVRATAGLVEVGAADATIALDFTLPETFRPGAGPGLALAASQRAKGIIAAAATLSLDRVLVTSLSSDGDVRYLVGGLYDVRRGMLQREGLLRLSGFTPPQTGLSGLASFLATGERVPLVELPRSGAAKALGAETLKFKDQVSDETPESSSHRALLRWSPVATLAAAVGLGAFAAYEVSVANQRYDDATALAQQPGYSASAYNDLVSQGDSAKTTAIVAGAGAGVAAVATGFLGWLSYRQTGQVGPFRF